MRKPDLVLDRVVVALTKLGKMTLLKKILSQPIATKMDVLASLPVCIYILSNVT
ncbi:hypothetical protein Scep_012951 [Stephania cephalantha]|uniref:Uncharacterized protein n=1 Tax=Stephania cephalantha TaxID=152367 RepID=A0AAP0JG22_9MAGN